MRHFFLDLETDQLPVVGSVVNLDPEESHHLGTVLRGGRQQEVVLTDGRGRRFEARVVTRDRRRASLEILSVSRDENEFMAPQLVLALAMIKTKRFEWALEKAVELGVHRIVPLMTEHVVKDLGNIKTKRWQTIIRTAIKQCGRSFLPEVTAPQTVESFLQDLPMGLSVFGAIPEEMGPNNNPLPLLALAAQKPETMPENLTTLIGPEGGWSETEVGLFLELGLQPITLGPHVLRAETAAAASLSGLQGVRQAWLA